MKYLGSFLAENVTLLIFGRDTLSKIQSDLDPALYHWWMWRYAQLAQQLIGSDKCPTLLRIFEDAIVALRDSNLIQNRATRKLYLCEYIQTSLDYFKYEDSISALVELEEIHGVKYSLSGALGRRTKHQSFSVPQLYIKMDDCREEPEIDELDTLDNKIDIINEVLDDDNTLAQIKFDDENIKSSAEGVTSLGSTIALVKMTVLMRTGPTKDRLNEEEQLTFINFVLSNQQAAPAIIFEALKYRSKLEVYKFAQAHRGMKQFQALVDFYDSNKDFSHQHFFASRLMPRWELRRMLCKSFISMGMTKSALEQYLSMLLIVTYTV